jgi:hypothetical protein
LAELLDLFLVGKLGGNRLAPAGPPGNNDLSLARGRAVAYVFHGKNLSIRPASAGHFFVVANCCYRRSCGVRLLGGAAGSQRLPQPILDFIVQGTQLTTRLCGQFSPQVVVEAEREPLVVAGSLHGRALT